MLAREDFFLQHLGTLALVDTGHFEDLGSIEPRVGAALHDGDAVDFHFVDVDVGVNGLAQLAEARANATGVECPPRTLRTV